MQNNKKKPYIVIMKQAPTATYAGGIDKLEPTKPNKGKKINPKRYVILLIAILLYTINTIIWPNISI